MNALLIPLAKAALRLVFPRAPRWVPVMLVSLLKLSLEAATFAQDAAGSDSTGPEILEAASDVLGPKVASLDIPGWEDVSWARKRRILNGLVELALFIWDIAADGKVDISSVAPRGWVPLKRRAPRSAE